MDPRRSPSLDPQSPYVRNVRLAYLALGTYLNQSSRRSLMKLIDFYSCRQYASSIGLGRPNRGTDHLRFRVADERPPRYPDAFRNKRAVPSSRSIPGGILRKSQPSISRAYRTNIVQGLFFLRSWVS